MAVGGLLAAAIVLGVLFVLAAQPTAAAHRQHGAAGAGSSREGKPAPDGHRGDSRTAVRLWERRMLGESPPDSLPFPVGPLDRATRRGEVPSLYADGAYCSTGCRPYGAETGWPLKPFHQQHPIRAGLNELRPGSLHVGIDIQAWDGTPVYAVQPGFARVLETSGPNARVQVGNYVYWHITPKVSPGEVVTPFKTVLGNVMAAYGHIAFSELNGIGQYVNPLRPQGAVLEPEVDRARSVIGAPALSPGGQVTVAAYSPQSFVRRTTYVTPVLAPAGLAYRLYDSHGTALTPLEWALRGTHLLPWVLRSLIFAPDAHPPGFGCFATHPVCVPHWVFRVAGGLAAPLPSGLTPGRYRLTIYAWNWADRQTALDTQVIMTPTGWRPIGHLSPALDRVPGYSTQNEFLAPPRTPPPATATSCAGGWLPPRCDVARRR